MNNFYFLYNNTYGFFDPLGIEVNGKTDEGETPSWVKIFDHTTMTFRSSNFQNFSKNLSSLMIINDEFRSIISDTTTTVNTISRNYPKDPPLLHAPHPCMKYGEIENYIKYPISQLDDAARIFKATKSLSATYGFLQSEQYIISGRIKEVQHILAVDMRFIDRNHIINFSLSNLIRLCSQLPVNSRPITYTLDGFLGFNSKEAAMMFKLIAMHPINVIKSFDMK